MVCAAPFLEGAKSVVLVSHHPVSVFTTTAEHIGRLKKKRTQIFYNREDLLKLVKQGHAVMYDEAAVRAISQAIEEAIMAEENHPKRQTTSRYTNWKAQKLYLKDEIERLKHQAEAPATH